jgi:hypothetical protein
MKRIDAIIFKNDRNEVYYIVEDIVGMALARDKAVRDIKKMIINNYKDYRVEFITKEVD